MWRCLFFLIGSAGVTWLSRGSLRRRDSHGFYRFFAFESILALIGRNAPHWLRTPTRPRQIASWSLLTVSLALAVHGFYLLRRAGAPDASMEDDTRLGIEKTTQLVRIGAYRYIRHPLYASLLLLAFGALLKGPSRPAALLTGVAAVALFQTARAEERENLESFGREYADYRRQTRMFIPYLL